MTYSELYKLGCLKLKAAEISEYCNDARLLIEHVCNTTRNDLYAHGDEEVSHEKESEFLVACDKRASHIPLQHITGVQWFMGLEFCVNEHVLVPRPDTETLVEEVLKDLHDGMSILDMCTGSGCILLSLLKYSNNCEGVGADISDKALEVSRLNAQRLQLDARFVCSDLFENITGKFDVIVSNPPYIRTREIEGLMPEVRDYDPFIALDGHEDGLYFYRKIIADAADYLKIGSLLAFEIGNDQGLEVKQLMEKAGFKEVTVVKDLCGNDRVVKGFF